MTLGPSISFSGLQLSQGCSFSRCRPDYPSFMGTHGKTNADNQAQVTTNQPDTYGNKIVTVDGYSRSRLGL